MQLVLNNRKFAWSFACILEYCGVMLNCKLDFFHPLKDNFHQLLYLPRVIVVVVAVYEEVPSQVGVEVVLVLPRLCDGGR